MDVRGLGELVGRVRERLARASWWRPVVAALVVVACAYAVWWYVFSSGILAPVGFVYAQY